MARTRKRMLHIAAQTGGYTTDPSANGSGYLYVPALTVGPPEDTSELLPTNYATGRVWDTAPETGADGATLSFTTPLIGLATAAGDGTNASSVTVDWLHTLLLHTFGATRTTVGEGLNASSTTTAVVLDTPNFTAQDITAIYESGVPTSGARSQWVRLDSVATNTWQITPDLAAAPTTAGVAYGARIITADDDGGDALACVVTDDDVVYTLLGGRVTSLTFEAEHGQMWRANWTVRFNTKTLDSGKTSLPVASAGPAVTPLKHMRSPFWFGDTPYATRRVTIDFGLETAVIGDSDEINGRAGDELIRLSPSITIEPLRTDAIVNLKRNATTGMALVQLGAGVGSGGPPPTVINTMAVVFDQATAQEVTYSDESGRTRQSVVFRLADRVIFTGTTAAYPLQIARC